MLALREEGRQRTLRRALGGHASAGASSTGVRAGGATSGGSTPGMVLKVSGVQKGSRVRMAHSHFMQARASAISFDRSLPCSKANLSTS